MTNKSWQEEFDEDIAFKNLHLYDNITIAAELVSQRDEKIKSFISKVEREAYEAGVRKALDIVESYFKGLVMIPAPEITEDSIKKAISKLLEKPNTPQS